MKTSAEYVAKVLAVVIWADNEYDDAERAAVSEIAEVMGYSSIDFQGVVEERVNDLTNSTEEEVNAVLDAAAKEIVPSEKGIVYEAAIEVILSDSIISREEVDRLLSVADALSVDNKDALTMIVDMVNPDFDAENDIVAAIEASNGDFDKLVEGVAELCDKIHDPEMFVIEK